MRFFRSKPRKPVPVSRINTITVSLEFKARPDGPWSGPLECWYEFGPEEQATLERLKALLGPNSKGEYRVVREINIKEVYR